MTMYRIPRLRRLRKSKESRSGHRRFLMKFLTDRQAALASTGAAVTVTLGTAAYGVYATGTLTASTRPSDGDTVTIGATTYTFKTTLSAGPAVANEVLIGANVAATHTNLTAAINGSAGAGTTYGTGTTANASATATAGATTTVLTAIAQYTAGNSVVTTEVGSNTSFGAATLTGGAAPTNLIHCTAHGYSVGDGPFLLSTSGALPSGLVASSFYYIFSVADADNFTLTGAFGDPNVVTPITSAGSGTQTMTRASDIGSIFEYLKHNQPAAIQAATDVDTL